MRGHHQGPRLLKRFNCNLIAAWISNHMRCNYSSNDKLQRLHHSSLGMDMLFLTTYHNGWNFLYMLGLKLIDISKSDHRSVTQIILNHRYHRRTISISIMTQNLIFTASVVLWNSLLVRELVICGFWWPFRYMHAIYCNGGNGATQWSKSHVKWMDSDLKITTRVISLLGLLDCRQYWCSVQKGRRKNIKLRASVFHCYSYWMVSLRVWHKLRIIG